MPDTGMFYMFEVCCTPTKGAAIMCPECGARQAISGARFAEYMARFPSGNCETYRAESGDPATAP